MTRSARVFTSRRGVARCSAARIPETTTLTTYDDYYRHQERQLASQVVRVKFDDADAT